MRTHRQILSIGLLLAIIVSFSGCIVIPDYKHYDDIDTENVSSVQIYDLRNDESRYSDFLETEVPVYTLKEDQLEEFWSDLSKIRFTDHILIVFAAIDPSFSYGEWVIRINCADDSYLLISCDGYGEIYDANDQVIESNHYSCDAEEWEQFIRTFLPKELFENESQNP